jgi:hypothetical protein
MLTRVLSATGFIVAAVVLGCGGDDSPTGDSFTLHVSADEDGVPLAGAVVAIDQADGSRSEGATGAAGVVTINGIDLSKGPFSFTVAAPGYVAVSSLDHTRAGDWQITLSRVGSVDSGVALTGLVRGKSDPDHFIQVSTATSAVIFDGVGPEYTLRVPANENIVAIVAEDWDGPAPKSAQGSSFTFFGWTLFAVGTVFSQTTMVDLVLHGGSTGATKWITGQALTSSTASGRLIVPPTMLGARGGLRVSSEESQRTAYLGGTTRTDLASNQTDLDYDAEFVSLPGASLTTEYWIGLDGAYSYAFRDTPPGDDVSLMDPPKFASPVALYGDLAFTNPTPDTEAWINIEREDRTVVWSVYGSNTGAFHMPKLPSAIDPRTVLGTGRMTARPEACRTDSSGKRCSEVALGAPADLVAP